MSFESFGQTRFTSNSKLLDSVQKFVVKNSKNFSRFRIVIQTSMPAVKLSVDVTGEEFMELGEFGEFRNAIDSKTASTPITQIKISVWQKGQQSLSDLIQIYTEDATAYLNLDRSSISSLNLEQQLVFADSIDSSFNLLTSDQLQGEMFPEIIGTQIKYRDEVVSDLQQSVEKLGTYLADGVRSQAEELRTANERLRVEWETKSSKLDEQYQAKIEALSEREEDLEKQIQQFDTRQSKYVRRGLLDEMNTVFDGLEKFKLSSYAQNKRYIIHITSIIGILLFGTVTGFGAYWLHEEVSKDTRLAWLFLSMTVAGTLGAGSLLVYYLRWTSKWFSVHVEQESFIRRMRIDAIRSSWIAELLFEWKDQHGDSNSQIPEVFLDKLSTGLFDDQQKNDDSDFRHEGLEKLVNDLRTVSVSKDGISLSRNKEK